MRGFWYVGPLALLAGVAFAQRPQTEQRPGTTARVSFREQIEPILKADCSGCHTSGSESAKLSFDSVARFLSGGQKFGKRIVVAGKPKASALIGYLRGTHSPRMPMGRPPLSEPQIALFETWIAQGAVVDAPKVGFPYTRPARIAVPKIKNVVLASEWAKNPIDAFVLEGLARKGLSPAPPASRTALMRRVFLDLVGMPPSLAESDAFLGDAAPDAYEKLVDRLLADPRYGERWARHWLDLVRYAETNGFEADNIRPRAWRYRDYVIRALNSDKPYDRFVAEQVAGDELFPNDPDARIATGFARLGPYDELSRDEPQRRQDYLNDATDTLGAGVLGLTIGCARCHDHKYDRVTQADYYRFQAFFANTKLVDSSLSGEVDPPEIVARRLEIRTRIDSLAKTRDTFRKELREKFGAPNANDDRIEELLRGENVDAALRTKWRQLDREWDDLNRAASPIERVAEAIADQSGDVPTQPLLLRGSVATPGEKLAPGFIASLCDGIVAPAPIVKPANANSSGARSALAKWLVAPQNPLTARVIVNRLWQRHFGRGIVGTPSDFGKNGEKPTHPELLDWLAGETVRRGWSLKSMHRLILTSATYRQSSVANAPRAAKLDPQNTLLWRQNRQRMEGEVLRDSILSVSGRLNPEPFGPSVYPKVSDEVLASGSTHKWGNSPEAQQRRRTIYVFQRRSLALPITDVFDGPDMVNACPRRGSTTIAPQALALFNGQFSREESAHFAKRVEAISPRTDDQIVASFRIALSRSPNAKELTATRAFLAKKSALFEKEGRLSAKSDALASLCHVLINTNEFLYVD